MPITVTAPTGVLTPAGERAILPQLSAALLEISGATGNPFFTGIVGGHLNLLPPTAVYAGGVHRPLVLVQLELPDIGLPDRAARAAFIAAATAIVDSATGPDHDRSDIWVTMHNAPDGGWGIGGRAYTGDELIAAVRAAS